MASQTGSSSEFAGSFPRSAVLTRLAWSNLSEDGWLTVRQGKTGALVELPVFALDPLNNLIASLSRDHAVMLTTESGRPWTPDNIRKRLSGLKKRADIVDLRFHDIRGTGLQMMAEAGCTELELAAISGHAGTKTQLSNYITRSRDLALSAYQKWDQKMNILQNQIAKLPSK